MGKATGPQGLWFRVSLQSSEHHLCFLCFGGCSQGKSTLFEMILDVDHGIMGGQSLTSHGKICLKAFHRRCFIEMAQQPILGDLIVGN